MTINNTQALSLLKHHVEIIVNQFALPNSQDNKFWRQAVAEELSFLLLIAYVDLTQSKGMDSYTKNKLDKLVDDWSGVITQFFYAKKNADARMIIKQKLNQKTQGYSPIIDNVLGAKLNNSIDKEISYKYELYQGFLDNILDNIEYRFSQKPQDDMVGAMSFISLSHYMDSVRQFVFDEKTTIMLSLSSHDTDEITEFDKLITSKNQNKKATRSRAISINDGVVNFITQCIYHDLQNTNNSNNNHANKLNHTNLLDGCLSPMQYFLSAIIPCFLILAINDSMFLFPPNISIPVFSTGDKVRDLTSGQDFWLWVSYLLAVVNLLYLQIKRLRDSNNNVVLCLVSFIPLLGAFFAIALAIGGQFPSNHGKQKSIEQNDGCIGLSMAASALALCIFLGVWLMATPT